MKQHSQNTINITQNLKLFKKMQQQEIANIPAAQYRKIIMRISETDRKKSFVTHLKERCVRLFYAEPVVFVSACTFSILAIVLCVVLFNFYAQPLPLEIIDANVGNNATIMVAEQVFQYESLLVEVGLSSF